jgi:hypothetical protein
MKYYQQILDRLDPDISKEELFKWIVCECSFEIQDMVDHRIPASEYSDRLKEIFEVN